MAELGHAQPAAPSPSATVGGLTNDSPAALATNRVIKNAAGKAFRISMLNTNVAARFLQIFDAAALPADATVPNISIPVGIGAFVQVDFGVYGRAFALGIVVCTSTTAATKTLGAADALFDASFL